VTKAQQADSDDSYGSMIGRKKRKPIRKSSSVSGDESSDKEDKAKQSGSEGSEKCKYIIKYYNISKNILLLSYNIYYVLQPPKKKTCLEKLMI